MRRTILALFALLAAAVPAAAQQKMEWYTTETDQGGALVFGVPDAEHALLFFLCERGSDAIVAQAMIGAKGLEKEKPARLTLSAGGLKSILNGKGVTAEGSEQVDVEAPGKLAELRALVKARGVLTVEVKGATQKISLAGAPAAHATFEGYCKKPKDAPKE